MTAAAIASAAAKIVEAQSVLYRVGVRFDIPPVPKADLQHAHKLLGEALQALAGETEGK